MGLKPVNCGCGGEAKVEPLPFETWNDIWDASVSQYLVRCDRCGMTTRLHDTETEAITAWNRAMSGSAEEKLKAFWDGMSAEMKEEQKKGKWIDTDNYYQRWKCSECGCHTRDAEPNYCPNCGADMRGDK